MKFDRVTFFDDVNRGDVLIYESDSGLQVDAERGRVISKSSNMFVVEWEETPNIPVSYYRREDVMVDWELYKVIP